MVDPSPASRCDELKERFFQAGSKQQLQLIEELVRAGEPGWAILQGFLAELRQPDLVAGKAYQALFSLNKPQIRQFLQTHFPQGLAAAPSERNLNYHLLQHFLSQRDYQAADSLTRQKLCELAGEAATQRKWVYFTEVDQFPTTDLQTIDRLWLIYSEGKFGFSVQRQLWLALGRDYTKLWSKIGWKTGNQWTRYPNGFTWNLSAPPGHLPLSNQLRGVRVLAAIFAHPAWSTV